MVRQQAEAGVDVVSDSEFGKTDNWAWYIHLRISGFSERPATREEAQDPIAPLHWAPSLAECIPPFNGRSCELKPRRQDRERAVVGPDICYFVTPTQVTLV